jgi:hypothetical protein
MEHKNSNEIEFKDFIIKVIAFHIRYWKLFAAGIIIAIIGSFFIISRPLPTSYQYHILIGCGEIPTDMVAQCMTSFSYDTAFTNIPKTKVKTIADFRKKGFVEFIIISDTKLNLDKIIENADNYLHNCKMIQDYNSIETGKQQRVLEYLKNISKYYRFADSVKVPDKGYIYGALISKELDLQRTIGLAEISNVRISNSYVTVVKESIGKRIIYSLGLFILIFTILYIVIFLIENAQAIRGAIKQN